MPLGRGAVVGRGMAMRSVDLRRRWETLWPVLLILVPGLVGTRSAGADELGWSREPDLFAYALVVLAALAASVVRGRPAVTYAGCGASVVTYLAVGYPVGPVLVAVPVAAAGVAVAWPPRRALLGNAALGVAVCLAGGARFGPGLADGQGRSWLDWLTVCVLAVGVPTAVGAAVRSRRRSEAGLRIVLARHAVTEERLRMAQELHDSVGHGLAVIAMQAGVALRVLDRSPAKARESLEAIQATSRESLHGMRAQLDVLRRDGDGDAPRRPAPGLADADVLLRRMRSGGLDVVADLRPGDLPPEVDVAAYRVLREALTNVLRHAGATRARVRVYRDGADLVLEVTDDGPAGDLLVGRDDDGHAGSGLVGMRARVTALDGEFVAGPRPGGGFAVRARLPVAGRATMSGSPT